MTQLPKSLTSITQLLTDLIRQKIIVTISQAQSHLLANKATPESKYPALKCIHINKLGVTSQPIRPHLGLNTLPKNAFICF